MRLAAALLMLMLAGGSGNLSAQDIPPPPANRAPAPPAEAGMTVIYAGTLLDRPGRPPRHNVTIVVRDGRIDSIEDGFAVAYEGARAIDLRDKFVLPGLIDSHVHLDSDRAGNEGFIARFTDGVALSTLEAAWNARKTLHAGFTTVRNLGSSDGVTLGLRDAINRGWAEGPRIVDAGSSISATTGHMDGALGVREELHDGLRASGNLCDGPAACREAVRRQIARGADVIKIATTGGVNSRIGLGLGAQMFEDEARALIETAHLYGKKVAVHAHGAEGINLALRLGADSIEHGTLIDDESIRLFLARRAFYVPTLSTVNGYLERIRANPNAYPPEVREKIDWRIRIPVWRSAAPTMRASGSPSEPMRAFRCTAATQTNFR